MSISRISTASLGTLALALLGTACATSGAADDTADSSLGNVREVVVSESTDEEGVTERLTVTLGRPAELDLTPVGHSLQLLAPWDYDPGESCSFGEFPTPAAEFQSGVAEQDGVYVAHFSAEFDSADAAHDAQSAIGWCYSEYTFDLAAELGRSPGTTDLEQLQEMGVEGGLQIETRITPPSFGDPGPVVFTVRNDRTVGFLVDLDNALDVHDGQSLAKALVEPGA